MNINVSNENVWEESAGLTSHETRVGGVQQVTGHMSALMRRGEEGEGRRGGFNCAYCSNENVWEESAGLTSHETRVGGV